MSEPEIKSVKLGEFLANRMIERIEKQPLEVEILLADGAITIPIPEGHAWHKAASERRNEQVKRLRASLKAKSETNK
jgi:hypothetical protein